MFIQTYPYFIHFSIYFFLLICKKIYSISFTSSYSFQFFPVSTFLSFIVDHFFCVIYFNHLLPFNCSRQSIIFLIIFVYFPIDRLSNPGGKIIDNFSTWGANLHFYLSQYQSFWIQQSLSKTFSFLWSLIIFYCSSYEAINIFYRSYSTLFIFLLHTRNYSNTWVYSPRTLYFWIQELYHNQTVLYPL